MTSGAMVALLLMGLPVSFGLLFIGIVGYWVLAGPAKTLSILGIVPYDKIGNYTLTVLLFILDGPPGLSGRFCHFHV